MNASDRQYLSKFELDPAMEDRWEDLYEFDFYSSEDEEMDPFDDESIPDDEIPSKK
jgi:hypothetical protein